MVDADLYPVIPSEVGHDRVIKANVVKLKAVNAALVKWRALATAWERRQYATLYLAHPHWLGAAVLSPVVYKRHYATVAQYQVRNLGAARSEDEEDEDSRDEMDLL